MNEEALYWYFMALEIREKAFGIEHQRTLELYNKVADVFKVIGNDEKANEFCQKAALI